MITHWIGSEHPRRGSATAAARLILEIDTARPILARAAKDNIGSLRVLKKCCFQIIGERRDFAEARGAITEEAMILRLDGAGSRLCWFCGRCRPLIEPCSCGKIPVVISPAQCIPRIIMS